MSLTLVDWRRRVGALYADVRASSPADAAATLERFRSGRNDLFANHPETPLDGGAAAPSYWPHRADLRFESDVDTDVAPITHATDEAVFSRFATVHLPVGDLDLYWLSGYGGGLFLPFRDATGGTSSYGGGRYLLDTVKGADLGSVRGRLVIDFNYAYHPSCFYSARWTCPLAPTANTLNLAVEAGERVATRP